MTQVVGDNGEGVTGRRNLWSEDHKLRAGLVCVKNLEEA